MEYRALGQSGIRASAIGLGTWVMGGWMWGGADEATSIRAIHAALDLGVNLIDTAPVYGFGVSEQIVGAALEGRRDKAIIATKCGLVANTRQGRMLMRATALGASETGHIEVFVFNGPDSIRREVDDSLRRLRTDRIDLYQTHWQEEQTPYEDTMAALLELKRKGKIRAIGVSNADVKIMDRYRRVGPLDCDQEKYSMLDRGLEAEQLPYCERHNIAVLAYSPLALGMLTGSTPPERDFSEGDHRRNHPRFTRENRARAGKLLDAFRPIAARHGCTLGQLALAWTIRQPGLTHALVGARDEKQVAENARGGEIDLGPHDLARMNESIRAMATAIV